MSIQNKLSKIKHVKLLRYLYRKFRNWVVRRRGIVKLQRHGYDVLAKVCQALKENEIKGFCGYGTLLGLIREGKFIGTDYDLDMIVIGDENFSWNRLDSAICEKGLTKIRCFTYRNKVTEQTYQINGLSVDFFLFEKLEDRMRVFSYKRKNNVDYPSNKEFTARWKEYPLFVDTEERRIHGIDVLLPVNATFLLEKIYGPTWQIPNSHFDGFTGIHELEEFGIVHSAPFEDVCFDSDNKEVIEGMEI